MLLGGQCRRSFDLPHDASSGVFVARLILLQPADGSVNHCPPKIRTGGRGHESLSPVLPGLDPPVDLADHHPEPGTCFLSSRVPHLALSAGSSRGPISLDISPYIRLPSLGAQTPAMLDLYLVFVQAWLQSMQQSSSALVLGRSRVLRPAFVQPDWCTTTQSNYATGNGHRRPEMRGTEEVNVSTILYLLSGTKLL